MDPERFRLGWIECLEDRFDTILCFNVVTNSPHYALGLERLLRCARRRVLLREGLGPELVVRYTPNTYLDEGRRHIRVYHNTIRTRKWCGSSRSTASAWRACATSGPGTGTEMVVDIPHHWRILLAERNEMT